MGSEDSLAGLTVATMQAFHRRWYGADRLAIVVAGAVDPQRCLGDLERSSLGQMAASDTPRDGGHIRALEPLSTVAAGRTTLRLKRLGCARLMACWVMPPAASQLCISGLELAAALLSEGRRSWLVARLREELGVVDDVDVDVIPLEEGSLVLLQASCEPSQFERVEGLLRQALVDWLQQPPREDDMQRACRLIVNGLCFGLETAASMAMHLGPALLRRRLEPLEKEFDRLCRWDGSDFHAQVMPLFALDQAHWFVGSASGQRVMVKLDLHHRCRSVELVAEQRHGSGVLALHWWISSGTATDPPGQLGRAQLLASSVQRGAAGRSAAALAEDFESRGATFGCSASEDATAFGLRCVATDALPLLERLGRHGSPARFATQGGYGWSRNSPCRPLISNGKILSSWPQTPFGSCSTGQGDMAMGPWGEGRMSPV